MAKYNVTYKCGHEDRVELFGKMSVREWRLERMGQELCPECQKRQQAEADKEFDKKNDLPELTGSPKQIDWARHIRRECFEAFEKLTKTFEEKIRERVTILAVEKHKEEQIDRVTKSQVDVLMDAISYVSEQTESKFFIDNRDNFFSMNEVIYPVRTWYRCHELYEKWADAYRDAHDTCAIAARQELEEAEKSAQVTIQPEQKGSNTIVTLKVQDDTVKLCSDYDSNLVDVIHKLELKMTWNRPCWEFKAELFRGTAESALIEIGNKLLEKGYTVVFPSREMADMALTGAFERYKMNAVYAHKTEKNTLVVEYDKSDNGIPVLLGFIRGSKFKRNSNMCYVPVSAYESLEELSEANNFAWSKAASERLETYKQSLIIANPVHIDRDSAVKPTRKDVDLSDLIDD